jgi:hypothetical protein
MGDLEPEEREDSPEKSVVVPETKATVTETINTPATVSLQGAREVEPKPPQGTSASRMSELEKAGVYLAWGVLSMITVLSLLLVILIAVGEFSRTSQDIEALQNLISAIGKKANPTAEEIKLANDTFQLIRDARKASREFWISLSQLILLNLLLPVLTAILGYIFGSRKNTSSS